MSCCCRRMPAFPEKKWRGPGMNEGVLSNASHCDTCIMCAWVRSHLIESPLVFTSLQGAHTPWLSPIDIIPQNWLVLTNPVCSCCGVPLAWEMGLMDVSPKGVKSLVVPKHSLLIALLHGLKFEWIGSSHRKMHSTEYSAKSNMTNSSSEIPLHFAISETRRSFQKRQTIFKAISSFPQYPRQKNSE